jgi:TetR/AcrR family transcriptional regulator, transcriptional repressor for nem operon
MVIMRSAPSRKDLSHERIVEVASRAIRRAGYQGVGVADLMREAGLTHGGFYAHFPSRDALLVEAIEHAGDENERALGERIAKQCAQGLEPFAALVHSYLHDKQLENVELGCVVAALSSETARQHEDVQRAARARVKALIDLVQRMLPAKVAADEAPVIAATMVGALQLARSLSNKAGKALLASTRQSLLTRYAR